MDLQPKGLHLPSTSRCKRVRSTSFGMYVAAINGLAERDHGPQSGWVYSVNGVQPNYTSGAYVLHDGDSVVWTYVNAVN